MRKKVCKNGLSCTLAFVTYLSRAQTVNSKPSSLCRRESSPSTPGKLGYCRLSFDYVHAFKKKKST